MGKKGGGRERSDESVGSQLLETVLGLAVSPDPTVHGVPRKFLRWWKTVRSGGAIKVLKSGYDTAMR